MPQMIFDMFVSDAEIEIVKETLFEWQRTFNVGDLDNIMKFYTKDAVMYPPTGPGRREVNEGILHQAV